MNLMVADDLLQGVDVSAAEALRDLAIGLFVDRRATLGQAARIAGVPQAEFQSWLADREIPLHYDVEDFEADLKTLHALGQL